MGRNKKEPQIAILDFNDTTDFVTCSYATVDKVEEDLLKLRKDIDNNMDRQAESFNNKLREDKEELKNKISVLEVKSEALRLQLELQDKLFNALSTSYIKTTKLFIFIDILFLLLIFAVFIFK